jgi:hypothetical protein
MPAVGSRTTLGITAVTGRPNSSTRLTRSRRGHLDLRFGNVDTMISSKFPSRKALSTAPNGSGPPTRPVTGARSSRLMSLSRRSEQPRDSPRSSGASRSPVWRAVREREDGPAQRGPVLGQRAITASGDRPSPIRVSLPHGRRSATDVTPDARCGRPAGARRRERLAAARGVQQTSATQRVKGASGRDSSRPSGCERIALSGGCRGGRPSEVSRR